MKPYETLWHVMLLSGVGIYKKDERKPIYICCLVVVQSHNANKEGIKK